MLISDALHPFYHFLMDVMDDFTFLMTSLDEKGKAHEMVEGDGQKKVVQDLHCSIVFGSCEFVVPKKPSLANSDVIALQVRRDDIDPIIWR